jgi:hypothetical protein
MSASEDRRLTMETTELGAKRPTSNGGDWP